MTAEDLLGALDTLDPQLAAEARELFDAAALERRVTLAGAIASRTIEARGFFEWESTLEDVTPAG